MLTLATFLKRIEDGKCNNLLYTADGKEGLIVVWKYRDEYIMTWEECRAGEQYDEALYTRDERYVFRDANGLLDFLAENQLNVRAFEP